MVAPVNLANAINLLPTNGKFGKLISILSLFLVGSYSIDGQIYYLDKADRAYIISLIFFRAEDSVTYSSHFNPIQWQEDEASISCFKSPTVIFKKGQEDYSVPIKHVCDNLGFKMPRDYMEFSYVLKSNMVILSPVKKEEWVKGSIISPLFFFVNASFLRSGTY